MEKSLATWTSGPFRGWKAYSCLSKDLRLWCVSISTLRFKISLRCLSEVTLFLCTFLPIETSDMYFYHSRSLQLGEKTTLISDQIIGSNNLGGL
jgi:hypothetical protein